MSYEIGWLVEEKVIELHVSGDIASEILFAASRDIIVLMDSSTAPLVHLIVNETDMGNFPKQIKNVMDAAEFINHPKMGWFLIYGNDSPFLNFLSPMVARVARLRHRRFQNGADAYNFLFSVDATLPQIERVAI